MLLHLSLGSGQTYCHSMEVLELVSVFDLHLWSKFFFYHLAKIPSNVIGFHVNRIKALLFILIRAFEFDLAIPAKDIGSKPNGSQRPVLLKDPNHSNQMPLLVTPVSSNL